VSSAVAAPAQPLTVARTSLTWLTIRITGQFSVNILSRDQQTLARG
jgi:flavin reductase (DIM6/NTAB) family NADH-FMN oxidoreductase RutF